jgi:hypothetical protein
MGLASSRLVFRAAAVPPRARAHIGGSGVAVGVTHGQSQRTRGKGKASLDRGSRCRGNVALRLPRSAVRYSLKHAHCSLIVAVLEVPLIFADAAYLSAPVSFLMLRY